MARKPKAEKLDVLQAMNAAGETVIFFKVKVPLNEEEHADLANKVRTEEEHSGIKIVLVPYSVEVALEAAGEAGESDQIDEGVDNKPAADKTDEQ